MRDRPGEDSCHMPNFPLTESVLGMSHICLDNRFIRYYAASPSGGDGNDDDRTAKTARRLIIVKSILF